MSIDSKIIGLPDGRHMEIGYLLFCFSYIFLIGVVVNLIRIYNRERFF